MQQQEKTVWKCLRKLKVALPYDPVIPILGIYPKELKSGPQRGICTLGFLEALFKVVKIREQPKCTLTEEWIKKMKYIYYL